MFYYDSLMAISVQTSVAPLTHFGFWFNLWVCLLFTLGTWNVKGSLLNQRILHQDGWLTLPSWHITEFAVQKIDFH